MQPPPSLSYTEHPCTIFECPAADILHFASLSRVRCRENIDQKASSRGQSMLSCPSRSHKAHHFSGSTTPLSFPANGPES